jgi:hypothetical protein
MLEHPLQLLVHAQLVQASCGLRRDRDRDGRRKGHGETPHREGPNRQAHPRSLPQASRLRCAGREDGGAAARVQCTNNLKQIGLAAHNYAGTYNVLPGLWTDQRTAYPTRDHASLFFFLLPFMEQQNLYNLGTNANPDVANDGYIHWSTYPAVGSTSVKAFLCPSDSGGSSLIDPDFNWATSNYAGNVMVFDPSSPRGLVNAMPDGTSNTIIMGHRVQWCDTSVVWGGPGMGTHTDWAAEP